MSNKSKIQAVKENYARALELAKALDAYNNKLACGSTSVAARNALTMDAKTASLEDKLFVLVYPNPAREFTTIKFSSPVKTKAVLQVYSMDGRQVSVLFNGEVEAGQEYEVRVQLKPGSSSMYFYSLQTDQGRSTGKILTIK